MSRSSTPSSKWLVGDCPSFSATPCDPAQAEAVSCSVALFYRFNTFCWLADKGRSV